MWRRSFGFELSEYFLFRRVRPINEGIDGGRRRHWRESQSLLERNTSHFAKNNQNQTQNRILTINTETGFLLTKVRFLFFSLLFSDFFLCDVQRRGKINLSATAVFLYCVHVVFSLTWFWPHVLCALKLKCEFCAFSANKQDDLGTNSLASRNINKKDNRNIIFLTEAL